MGKAFNDQSLTAIIMGVLALSFLAGVGWELGVQLVWWFISNTTGGLG